MTKNKISVVMSVYKNDKASWLRQSIDSLLNQTHMADEIIIVVDGPVPQDILNTLYSYDSKLRVIKLKENKGLWNALNIGITAAKFELIARMDSDDIALPQRFELQIAEFARDKDLKVLGGQIDEFSGNQANIINRRIVPEEQSAIAKFSKRRSPFNHPTVMYNKHIIQGAGGYRKLSRSEDYDLWVRLLKAGHKMKNLHETVLLFRVNSIGIARRKTWLAVSEQIKLRKSFLQEGYIGLGDFLITSGAYVVMYLLPVRLASKLYARILRISKDIKT